MGAATAGDRADLSAPMPTPDAPPPVVGELDELPEGVTLEAVDETGVETGEAEAVAADAGEAAESGGSA